MNTVLVKTDSHYSVNRAKIRQTVDKVLSQKKVTGNVEVSVNIIGDRLMRFLNKKYRQIDETTDVLSFSQTEEVRDVNFISFPHDYLRLGDIAVSYPQAIEEASDENKMVDDKISELVEHGLLHLLGIHHEE